ncbi:response regulator [Hymenobacter fastidiosus]|uniref:Response regulator n=1 Tax=Hymenobacter fastidiosus TaxID=486264 RepID=A0ABP7RY25_9BACT
MRTTLPAPILVVEDNLEDFTALSRAFRKHTVPNAVVRCADGEQALEYLRGHGRHPAWPAVLPAFVLLDLNMPGLDGRDVLGALKLDPVLRAIPIVVFTTSANVRDVEECYRLGANSYLTKPMGYSALEEKVGLLARYWLDASELPHPG